MVIERDNLHQAVRKWDNQSDVLKKTPEKKGQMTGLLKCIRYSLFLLAICLFLSSLLLENLNWLLISVAVLWLGNVFYAFEKIRERFVFFLFNCSCLFFLFGRNLVELFSGQNWTYRFSVAVNQQVLSLIFVSLFALFFGAVIADSLAVSKRRNVEKSRLTPKIDTRNLQIIAFVLFCLCALFLLITEFDKLLFMRGKEYYQYYAEYAPRVPSIFVSIGALTKYVMILFLITLPSKKLAFPIFCIYLLTTVPMFLIGQRNTLMSACLFIAVYYFLRDYLENYPKKWFGKIEKVILILALPFGLAFLSLYEQLRYGKGIGNVNILQSIINLFRSQGVTYDVIGKGIEQMPYLPSSNVSYTFGPWINYFKNNFVSNFLFGTQNIRSQTLESALYGNSFADSLSYLELGDQYLNGAGLGSSYIIETFIDFSWVGMALFGVFLGTVTILVVKLFHRNLICSFISLNAMINFFMLPRSAAMNWTVFLFYVPMYIVVMFVFILVSLVAKHYFGKRKTILKEKCNNV